VSSTPIEYVSKDGKVVTSYNPSYRPDIAQYYREDAAKGTQYTFSNINPNAPTREQLIADVQARQLESARSQTIGSIQPSDYRPISALNVLGGGDVGDTKNTSLRVYAKDPTLYRYDTSILSRGGSFTTGELMEANKPQAYGGAGYASITYANPYTGQLNPVERYVVQNQVVPEIKIDTTIPDTVQGNIVRDRFYTDPGTGKQYEKIDEFGKPKSFSIRKLAGGGEPKWRMQQEERALKNTEQRFRKHEMMFGSAMPFRQGYSGLITSKQKFIVGENGSEKIIRHKFNVSKANIFNQGRRNKKGNVEKEMKKRGLL
jgi:hypothetical protein